ncbi:MAG TPA: NosD domain-containing protein [Candidatus Acidoferrum sp.]|nr:NosD domain-containing protein [Candidatus Acidoferrum sp.]
MLRRYILVICLVLLLLSLVCVLYLRSAGFFESKPSSSFNVRNLSTGIEYETIQEALDAAETRNGQTISVEPGVFYEHIIARKSVYLIGKGKQNTILDGDGTGTVVSLQASVVLSGFTIQNGGIGVAVNSSNDGLIANSVIQHNEEGLCLLNSKNWTLSSNLLENNSDSSLILNDSDGNVIEQNSISYDHSLLHDSLDLYDSSYNSILENNLTDNQATGIQLNDNSLNNTVSDNFLMNNWGGIQLVSSCNYNVIRQNSIIANETTLGLTSAIWIKQSQCNTVYANEITSDRNSAAYRLPYEDGVGLSESTNNSVVSNKISFMDTGVGFHFSCENNSIIDNTIEKNGHGIDFSEGISNDNYIYSNNFIQNAEQVYNVASTNIWDNANVSSGNYWSDYQTKYPNASEVDSSGIWGTSYIIDSTNIDEYPLKVPFVLQNVSSSLTLQVFMMIVPLGIMLSRRNASGTVFCLELQASQFESSYCLSLPKTYIRSD